MSSLQSTSYSSAPWPRAKKIGSPPTARKARTGELTPPGITSLALSKSLRESMPIVSGPLPTGPSQYPVRFLVAQRPRRLHGEVGDNQIGPGSADRDERLHHDALAVDEAALCRRDEHGVLPGDMIRGDRHLERLADPPDDVEIRKGRLHHHHVGPLLDVQRHLPQR